MEKGSQRSFTLTRSVSTKEIRLASLNLRKVIENSAVQEMYDHIYAEIPIIKMSSEPVIFKSWSKAKKGIKMLTVNAVVFLNE